MDNKKKVKAKKAGEKEETVLLSEELQQALGGVADVIVDKKVSQEDKKRKRLKEEKKAQKAEQKGKRAKKREELEVFVAPYVVINRKRNR